MKKSRIHIVVVMTVILLLATVSAASGRGNPNPGVLPPTSRVQGLTYGEWEARYTQYVFSIPTLQNPYAGGTGNHCIFQRNGNVALVAYDFTLNEIECEVPVGMKLFLVVLGVECSTVEPFPFYGGNEEELRACATSFTFTDLQASIDGIAVTNLDRYLITSPLFQLTLPEDNILGSDELTALSVAHSVVLMLAPLSPGEHTIYLHATNPVLEFTLDQNIDLIVAR
jgi:hypothetical protein